jgi:hypothetical protein
MKQIGRYEFRPGLFQDTPVHHNLIKKIYVETHEYLLFRQRGPFFILNSKLFAETMNKDFLSD